MHPTPDPALQTIPRKLADHFAYYGLVAVLFASIFLQRFAIPGAGGASFNLLVTVVVMILLLVRGAVLVEPLRLMLFLAFAAAVLLSTALNAGVASLPSAALVFVIYAPYCCVLRQPDGFFVAAIRAFQTMVLICAMCGIAQFTLQFAIGRPPGLFTFDDLIPSSFLLEKFNTANPLRWDSPILKSNGFFFLEPSTFSQYLALAIVFELLFRGMTARLAVYCIALPTSYSGTGILLLLVMVPGLLIYRRDWRAVAGLGLLATVALVLGDLWNMNALLSRASEFGSEDSSAHARFFAGARLIAEYVLDGPELAFGLGPGSFLAYAKLVAYEAHDTPWAKILFEYGLLGTLLFWPMQLATLFANVVSRGVGLALLIGFIVFGGMVLDPRLQALILVFCALPGRLAVTSEPHPTRAFPQQVPA